jgi:hypothetical protein
MISITLCSFIYYFVVLFVFVFKKKVDVNNIANICAKVDPN